MAGKWYDSKLSVHFQHMHVLRWLSIASSLSPTLVNITLNLPQFPKQTSCSTWTLRQRTKYPRTLSMTIAHHLRSAGKESRALKIKEVRLIQKGPGIQTMIILSPHHNGSNGCQWIGELRSLHKHLLSCEYTLLRCPNQCHKRKRILKQLRKDIDKHTDVQDVSMSVKETGEYKERTTTHLKTCPKICSSDGCGEAIQRCKILGAHLN